MFCLLIYCPHEMSSQLWYQFHPSAGRSWGQSNTCSAHLGASGLGSGLAEQHLVRFCCCISSACFWAWRKICGFQGCQSGIPQFAFPSTEGQDGCNSSRGVLAMGCKWCLVYHPAFFPNKCVHSKATIWTHHLKAVLIARWQNHNFLFFQAFPQ